MIQLAMKQEVSWTMLSSFLDDASSTIEKSKQVIRILLDEFENLSKYPNNGLRNARVFSENEIAVDFVREIDNTQRSEEVNEIVEINDIAHWTPGGNRSLQELEQ